MPRWPLTTEERFDQKYIINPINGCWEWISGLDTHGYASFFDQKKVIASRYSYERFNNIKPNQFDVCHHCDNPRCVNPKHLFLGTQKDNMNDAQKKGRLPIMKHPSFTSYDKSCKCKKCSDKSNEIYINWLHMKNERKIKYRLQKKLI